MRAWAAWRERFTRGNTLHSWFLPLVLPSLLPPSSTLNLTHPNQHLGSIPCSCRRFICSPFLVCQVQPLILRDLCKKASCDPPPPPLPHCIALVTACHNKVALYPTRIKRSHHKPTVRSSLSIPWHCLGNLLGLRTIFIKWDFFTCFSISANHILQLGR